MLICGFVGVKCTGTGKDDAINKLVLTGIRHPQSQNIACGCSTAQNPKRPAGRCALTWLYQISISIDTTPARLKKKGPSRTFEQTIPQDLAQAYCSRAAGHAARFTVLRMAPGAKGRPEIAGYHPRRHSHIADHPPKMAPGAKNSKKSWLSQCCRKNTPRRTPSVWSWTWRQKSVFECRLSGQWGLHASRCS